MVSPDPKRLPGLQDLLVTFCEFMTGHFVAASFFMFGGFKGTTVEAIADEGFNALALKFALKDASWVVAVFVLLPHAVACCKCNLRLMCHPYLPAMAQPYKLTMFYYGWKLYSSISVLELKSDDDLKASIILAACEFAIVVDTVRTSSCSIDPASKHRGNYPRQRLGHRFMIFVNLWKDVGILSTWIKFENVFILLIGLVPGTLVFTCLMIHKGYDSQHIGFHLVRLLLLGIWIAMCYVIMWACDDSVEFAHEKMVPIVLLVCEVVMAICELRNGAKAEIPPSDSLESPII